jgi:superfamily II DNA or RNA helicase
MRLLYMGATAHVEVDNESELERIKARYTLQNSYTGEIIKLYSNLEEHWNEGKFRAVIRLPRGSFPGVGVQKEYQQVVPPLKFKGTLRPNQEPLSKGYLNHISNHNGGIIKADTGTGKTVIALDIIAKLNLRTLILVPTTWLMDYWTENVFKFLGVKLQPHNDYLRQSNHPSSVSNISIGMIHSACKTGEHGHPRYPDHVYTQYGLIIWDEVHRLAAPTFVKTGNFFNSWKRLGLSATPRRKDGLEEAFLWHIGSITDQRIKQELTPNIYIYRYDGILSDQSRFIFRGELHIPMYLNMVTALRHRNYLIARSVYSAYVKGRNILVLSDRIRQLETIHKYLDTSIPENFKFGWFTGTKKDNLDSRIILATYGSAGLGADIPRLDTLVLASPRTDVEQAVGRILRKTTPKRPVVVDVIDTKSSVMMAWYRKRGRFYRSKGYKIIEV